MEFSWIKNHAVLQTRVFVSVGYILSVLGKFALLIVDERLLLYVEAVVEPLEDNIVASVLQEKQVHLQFFTRCLITDQFDFLVEKHFVFNRSNEWYESLNDGELMDENLREPVSKLIDEAEGVLPDNLFYVPVKTLDCLNVVACRDNEEIEKHVH